jgi:hypothetical protein
VATLQKRGDQLPAHESGAASYEYRLRFTSHGA